MHQAPGLVHNNVYCTSWLASVPGLPRSVRVLIMRMRKRKTLRMQDVDGRPVKPSKKFGSPRQIPHRARAGLAPNT